MKSEYSSLCQRCIWEIHPTMLTGYCIQGTCDRCGTCGDLAMVRTGDAKGSA
jgi:hypothetical protein